MYVCMYVYIYIYIYIYIEGNVPPDCRPEQAKVPVTRERIFNTRVSNPNKLIVDVFLTRCRISMCQGLGPKNTMKFRKTDRTGRVGKAITPRRLGVMPRMLPKSPSSRHQSPYLRSVSIISIFEFST